MNDKLHKMVDALVRHDNDTAKELLSQVINSKGVERLQQELQPVSTELDNG